MAQEQRDYGNALAVFAEQFPAVFRDFGMDYITMQFLDEVLDACELDEQDARSYTIMFKMMWDFYERSVDSEFGRFPLSDEADKLGDLLIDLYYEAIGDDDLIWLLMILLKQRSWLSASLVVKEVLYKETK